MMSSRGRRWMLLALALGLAAFLVWSQRDLPRRRVERALETRLAAEVSVGRLQIHGTRQIELRDVVVRRPAGQPGIELIDIDRIDAIGPVAAMVDGHFDELHLSGALIRVDLRAWQARAATDEPVPAVTIGRLTMQGARLHLGPSGNDPGIEVSAELRGIPEATEGTVRLAAGTLHLGQPAGMAGRLDGTSATLTVRDAGQLLLLDAAAERLTLARGQRHLTIEAPSLAATGRLDPDSGRLSIEVEPQLPAVASSHLGIELYPVGSEGHLQLSVQGLQLDHWLQSVSGVLPAGWGATGSADLDLRASTDTGLDYRVAVQLEQLSSTRFGGVHTYRGSMSADGALAPGSTGWGGPLRAQLVLNPTRDPERGESPLSSALGELRSTLRGEVHTAPTAGLSGELQVTVGRDAVWGRLTTTGSLGTATSGPLFSADWSWSGCRLGQLRSLAGTAGLRLPEALQAEAEVRARGDVVLMRGETIVPRLSGRIELTDLEAALSVTKVSTRTAGATWVVAAPRTAIDIDWRGGRRPIRLGVEAPVLTMRGLGDVPIEAGLNATADVQPETRHVQLRSLLLDAGPFGKVQGTGAARPGQAWSAELVLSGLQVPALRPLLAGLLPEGSLAGTGTATLTLTGTGVEKASGRCQLGIDDLGYSSSDGARVIEGLGLRADLVLDVSDQGTARLQGGGRLSGPILLWETVFADLSGHETWFELELERLPGGDGSQPSWHSSLHCDPDPATTLELSAQIGGAPVSWSAKLQADDLRTTVERLLRQPLQGSLPLLDRLQLAGALSAQVSGTLSNESLAVEGWLKLDDCSLDLDDGQAKVGGLELSLPLSLISSRSEGGKQSLSGPTSHGSLRFQSLSLAGLHLPPTASQLLVAGDTITLEKTLSLPLLNGSVDLDRLTLAELLRPSRRLQTAVHLRRISLGELSRVLGTVSLDGQLDGSFSELRLTRDSLQVVGDSRLSLFGGTVTISDITGSEVLSRYPRLGFSASFDGIDLAQLTGTFDFGEMSGILRGEVRDCELFRGVPVRCAGRIETVPVEDVPQSISLKAINNIAIVGTGGGVSLIDRGIHRFLRHYRYERIGIGMQLADDRFLLRGLERRGERELFLKGRYPFRIDVVNVQPGATVSFRTMLERIQNLDLSGVRSEP